MSDEELATVQRAHERLVAALEARDRGLAGSAMLHHFDDAIEAIHRHEHDGRAMDDGAA